MCIAIASEKGNEVPCKQYLETCFKNNSDGAGFAFAHDGKVTIIKGLMAFDDFWKTFSLYNEKYDFKKCGVLIHFRIQTHGGVNKECTHPFPLTDNEKSLHATEVTTDYAVIHNGIITLTSYDARKEKLMSDTMVFIRDYLYKLSTNKDWFFNPVNWELIYQLADSKIAVLNSDGVIKHTEGFTKDADGNWYSNTSYKEARKPKTTTYYDSEWWKKYGHGYYDPWDDDDYYSKYSYNSSTLTGDKKDNTSAAQVTIPMDDGLRETSVPLMKYKESYKVAVWDTIEDGTESDGCFYGYTHYGSLNDFIFDGITKALFIDESGNLYISYVTYVTRHINANGKEEEPDITSNLYYVGEAEFYDDKHNPIPFKPSYYIDPSRIYDYAEIWEDEQQMDEYEKSFDKKGDDKQ